MTQGNIAKYLVKVGDTVQAGDRIAEIETDKATVDFDIVDEGTVAKILLPEGTQDVLVRCLHAPDRAAPRVCWAQPILPSLSPPSPASPPTHAMRSSPTSQIGTPMIVLADDPADVAASRASATFPTAMEARLAIQPGTLGYPDVDTYRDLYFIIEGEPGADSTR
jgi:pyruvate dehydrogenase E2 component (dihydrolipoamide acetyltransferase)